MWRWRLVWRCGRTQQWDCHHLVCELHWQPPVSILGATTLPERLSPAASLQSIYPPLPVQPASRTTLFEAPRNERETCSNLADFWMSNTYLQPALIFTTWKTSIKKNDHKRQYLFIILFFFCIFVWTVWSEFWSSAYVIGNCVECDIRLCFSVSSIWFSFSMQGCCVFVCVFFSVATVNI